MPDETKMLAAVHAYVAAFDAGDPKQVVALFAQDATVEDPVGSPVKEGIAAIEEFYTASMATGAKLQLQEPVRIAADYAVFAFQVQLEMDGNAMTIDVIDTFQFNTDNKVIEMRAFWGPSNMTSTAIEQ